MSESVGKVGREPVRWGIAGTGRIAADFAADLALLPDARLVAVGSRSKATADVFGDQFDIPARHASYADLAADPHVDAIYVAVPHTGHCAVTLAAIDGGKAVLCEKPFSVNAQEADRMIHAATMKAVPLMEAMWVRFLPPFTALRELIGDGRIGTVRSVIADRGAVLSTDPRHRVRDPRLAGGALLDLGVYPVSFASMVCGGAEPERVEALAVRTDTGVDARTSAILGYENDAQALISTLLDAQSANQASVTGDRGRIDLPVAWSATGPLRITGVHGGPEILEFTHKGHGLRHQAAELGRLLYSGQTQSSVIPHAETLAVMRTLDRIRDRIGLRYPGEPGGDHS